MSYCGICDKHGVSFTQVKGGYYCDGCDEIHLDDDIDRDNALRTLIAAKNARYNGWKIYPDNEWGKPINEVIKEYEDKCQKLGVKF